MAWLTREGQVLATAEVAATRGDRRRGLLGRTEVDGVFVLKARSVHTVGMQFPIDVAFCDHEGVVLKIVTMVPNRVTMPVWKARSAIEAPAGAFRQWSLRCGDTLEIR
ncbi:MAG TPA: DUF192 domain-containing protein [Microthrixaceae bacterium]|nr:DUF192 domain-containing protein [Microthrixaceae bacterium]